MPPPVPPADGLLAAAPPPTGGSPPVAGPFCAIASEVAPAIKAAASAIVLRVAIVFLRKLIEFGPHPSGTHGNSAADSKFHRKSDRIH